MKRNFVKYPVLTILILWTLIACNKGELNSYDVVQSNFITNATLDSMYIKPFKSQSLWKLTFSPKGSDVVTTFYIEKQTDSSYNMFGQSRNYYHPVNLNPIFSTNSIAAMIDFTETSYTSSLITVFDKEFTRGADHLYSFGSASASKDTMFMEGVQYGDVLTMVALAENSEEYQFIKNGGIEKQFEPFEKWCANTPFVLWKLNGYSSPMQAFVDPVENKVWLMAVNSLRYSYAEDINFNQVTSSSSVIDFTLNAGGDTLLLATPYEGFLYSVIGFVFNKGNMNMKPIERYVLDNNWIYFDATNQNMPGMSFVEMATFFYYESGNEDAKITSNYWAKNFHLQNSFTIYNDSVNNSSTYTANWSSIAKSQYLNMMNSVEQFYGGSRKVLGLSVSLAPRAVMRYSSSANNDTSFSGGNTLDYQFNIIMKNGSSLDSLIYVIPRGGADSYTLLPSNVYFNTGTAWDSPGMTFAAKVSPKNNSGNQAVATTLWPSVYNFLKLFENGTAVSDNFLPRVDEYGRFGVQLANTVKDEKISGEVKIMTEY